MQRNEAQSKKNKNEANKNFIIPIHDEVEFKDIAKYLDVQMQESIKKQLEGIDNEVENLGKVCDNLYQKSYNEYKNILDKEREELDNNVKKYISDLKDNLIDLRTKINYDYKGKFKEINSKLNILIDEIKKSTKKNLEIQFKKEELNEDSIFYEKQIDYMKDLNIYLKYKLKLFLGDIQEKEKEEQNIKEINKDNKYEQKEDKKISNNQIKNNRYENVEENKIKNKSKTKIKENTTKEINKNKKINIKRKNKTKDKEDEKNDEEDKLYITATENMYDSNKNEFNEVEYLNSKFDLEEAQLMNYIQYEKEKNSKLSDIYNSLFSKTNNQYFKKLKELIDENKTINSSKSLEKNNFNESGSNNRSVLPSVYSTMSNSGPITERKNMYTAEYPGPGYITRKENKEIIINFLENLETKKLIYQIIYGESN